MPGLSIIAIAFGIVIAIVGLYMAYKEQRKDMYDQNGYWIVGCYAIAAFGLMLSFIFGFGSLFAHN